MKILFVGNSHTFFNDMPQTTADLVKAATGRNPEVMMLAYSGRTLEWHRNEYYSLRFALLYGDFDWCVLQDRAHPFAGKEALLDEGSKMIDFCRRNHTTPLVMTSWARKNEPWIQNEMNDAFRALKEQEQVLLAPVGEIWQIVQREHPELPLYADDGAHASPYGSYLEAVTICCAITGCDPAILPSIGRDFHRKKRGLKKAGGQKTQEKATEDKGKCLVELDEPFCSILRLTVKKYLVSL